MKELDEIDDLDEVPTMLQQLTEEWRQDGLRTGLHLGLQQGLEMGLKRGRQWGQVAILRRQLTVRFGPLPSEVIERIRIAKSEQLENWASSVLNAPSLEGVFGGK